MFIGVFMDILCTNMAAITKEITLEDLKKMVVHTYRAALREHDDDEYEYDDPFDDWYCTSSVHVWIDGETGQQIDPKQPHEKGIELYFSSTDFSDVDYDVTPADPDVGYRGDIEVAKCTCDSYDYEVYNYDNYWNDHDDEVDGIVESWIAAHDADIKQLLEEVAEPEKRW